MTSPIRILHLDDSSSDALLVALTLEIEEKKLPTSIQYVQTKEEYLKALEQKDFDLILSDYRMPGFDGDHALAAAREKCPEIPFIMVTGELGEELVIETLHRGATDYVLKDRMFRLVPAIERALTEAENYKKRRDAEREIKKRQGELWAIIQAMHGGILVLDTEGNVVLVNDALVSTLGYKNPSDLKQNITHIAGTLELSDAGERILSLDEWPLSRIMRGEAIDNIELEGRRRDTGKTWFFSISGRPVWDENGKQILAVVVVRDITERKAQEEALRLSEERFALAFRASPDPFVIGRVSDGTILDINDSFLNLFGYTREEVIGQSSVLLEMFVHHEDREKALALIRQDGELRHFETHVRNRSGEERVVLLSSELLKLGGEAAFLTIIHDVTEQQQAQAALRESEGRVRRKLESILSPEGDLGTLELADLVDIPALKKLLEEFYAVARLPIGVIDIKGHVLVGIGWQNICTDFHRVHPETCKHCIESDTELSAGVPQGEFRLYKCKNNLWDVATPIIVAGHHVGNLFSGQFFFENETIDREFFRSQARLYGFDEEEYFAALAAVPRLSRDTVDHGMKFLQNLADTISQQGYSNVKLARALAERDRLTNKLHVMFERAPLGLVEVDREDRFIAVNPRLCQMLGYTKEELLGMSVNRVSAPEDRTRSDQMNASLREPGRERVAYEKRYLKKDGTPLWVNVTVSALRDQEDHFTGAIGTIEDITNRRRAEEELRKSFERELEERVRQRTTALERANKELEGFTYSVSHDLKAPLRLISGFADLLVRQGTTLLTEKQKELLGTIQNQAARMDELIKALLDFSRLTQKEIRRVKVDTRKLVEEIVAEQRQVLGDEAGARVVVEVTDLPTVEADPILLRIVFTNLLSNAFKFTRTVTAPRVAIDAMQTESFYSFRIQDNGVGFPKGQAELLFKVFQRLHRQEEFEGTGIGLANVRKIVEKHGGQVCGEGEESKGAAFYFTLPAKLPWQESSHNPTSMVAA